MPAVNTVMVEGQNNYGSSRQDSLAFFLTVYHIAEQIPRGKVTTYGHLAYLAGKPNNSRQAGQALKLLPRSDRARYNVMSVPWWRVINASGRVSQVEHRDEQHELLQAELEVSAPPYSLVSYGWFPEPEEVDLDFDSV